jgi:hypothetical protein
VRLTQENESALLFCIVGSIQRSPQLFGLDQFKMVVFVFALKFPLHRQNPCFFFALIDQRRS